jgi:hypothetical protein
LLANKRRYKQGIHSLHVLEVSCIAKEKAHQEHELESKISVASLSGSKAVVEIANREGNPHDGKT